MAVVEAHAQAQAARIVRLAVADGSIVDGQGRRRDGGDCYRESGKRKKLGDSREQHGGDLWLLWCCDCRRRCVFVWCVEVKGGGNKKFVEEGTRQFAAAEVGHVR